MKAHTFLAAVAVTLTLAVGTASALPVLSLHAGSQVVTVEDNNSLDINSMPGVITFIGPIGNWILNVSTGFSGLSGGLPFMHLNSVDMTMGGTGTLMVMLGDHLSGEWGAPAARVSAGGTFGAPGSTACFMTMLNGNHLDTMNFDTSSGLAFAGEQIFPFDPFENDFVELCATIFHPPGRVAITSFDYQITPVPEPGTLMLLGTAFLCLAVYGKRRAYRKI